MDLSRLSTATKVITGAAIVLFIVSFFSWATAGAGGFSVSQNGWHGFTGIIFGLSVVLLIAWQAVKIFGVKLPELPAGDRQIELGVIGAVVILTVLKVLVTSDVSINGASGGHRVWWVQILALLAAGAIAWGGWQIYSGAAEDAPAAASSGDSPMASSPPAPAAPAAPALRRLPPLRRNRLLRLRRPSAHPWPRSPRLRPRTSRTKHRPAAAAATSSRVVGRGLRFPPLVRPALEIQVLRDAVAGPDAGDAADDAEQDPRGREEVVVAPGAGDEPADGRAEHEAEADQGLEHAPFVGV